jgi:hypothetical protein
MSLTGENIRTAKIEKDPAIDYTYFDQKCV